MNSRGRDESALRVPPATQRLEGDEEPVAQVDLRLVPSDDLAPLRGEVQFSRQALLLRHAIPLPGVQGARPIVTCDHHCGETADSGPMNAYTAPEPVAQGDRRVDAVTVNFGLRATWRVVPTSRSSSGR